MSLSEQLNLVRPSTMSVHPPTVSFDINPINPANVKKFRSLFVCGPWYAFYMLM